MECIICRKVCAETVEFIVFSMRKAEKWYIHLTIKMILSKIKIQDFAFYGFEYKQKKSEVEIHCKNEMIKKRNNDEVQQCDLYLHAIM